MVNAPSSSCASLADLGGLCAINHSVGAGRPFLTAHNTQEVFFTRKKRSLSPASKSAFLPYLKGLGQETRSLAAASYVKSERKKTVTLPRAPTLPCSTRPRPPSPAREQYIPLNVRTATSGPAMRATPHLHLVSALNLRGLR